MLLPRDNAKGSLILHCPQTHTSHTSPRPHALQVDEHNITRLRMNADMADASNAVKQLIIKAEDARILGDMKAMRKYYRQLADMNRWAWSGGGGRAGGRVRHG